MAPPPIVHALRGYLVHECALVCQSFERSLLLDRRDASAHFPHLFLLLSLSRLMRRSTSGAVPITVTMTTAVITRGVITAADGLPLRRGSNYTSRGRGLKDGGGDRPGRRTLGTNPGPPASWRGMLNVTFVPFFLSATERSRQTAPPPREGRAGAN